MERQQHPRPDDERDWIGTIKVAQLIGITPQAVAKRLRRGRMPGVFHRGAWWVQREHALVAANVKATTGPDDVTEKAARAVLATSGENGRGVRRDRQWIAEHPFHEGDDEPPEDGS